MYNLTESQKTFLKWLVAQIRAGKLEEEFMLAEAADEWVFEGYEEYYDSPPKFSRATLVTLQRADLLYLEDRGTYYQCAITARAYQAIDTNFSDADVELNHGRLQAFLTGYFKLDELRSICMSLGIDDELLNGTNKNVFALDLITHARNRNQLWELIRVAFVIG